MGLSQVDRTRWHEGLHRTKRMREAVYAVIHQVPGLETPGMLEIAGLPLIARQLEWLIGMGCDGVIVEVGEDAASREVARWVANHCGDGTDVIVVVSGGATHLGAREAARRAGIGPLRPVLAIPADLLGNGDLTYMVPVANPFGVVAFFDPPSALVRKLSGGTVRLVRAPLRSSKTTTHEPLRSRGQPSPIRGLGWAARIQSPAAAAAMTEAVIFREVPGLEACERISQVA